MFRVVPVKRLASLKMKLLYAFVFVVGIIFVATATAGSLGSIAKEKIVHFVDSNGNFDLQTDDVANILSLRLAQVIFRHGDRTPIERYPLDPYDSRKYWPEGWGKLTNVNLSAKNYTVVEFGRYIRKRYDGYLGRTYTAEEIYVQSSDKDRTIQSALANLAGMWPATTEEQQYVPVHSISAVLDNKIAFTMPCAKYAQLYAAVPHLPSEKSFDLENAELYKYLSEHTGLKVTTYHNVSDIFDILFVQKCHNLTLPEWTKQVFPNKMVPVAERWLKAQMFTGEMLRLRVGPLLTEMIRNMKRVAEKPTEQELKILEVLFNTPAAKLFVYSGHDTTVSPLLDAMGVFNGKFPPYASSLYFELHENEVDKSFFVKVFYKADLNMPAVEIQLEKCNTNPCRFEDFMRIMDPYIMDEKQWEKECRDI